MFTGGSRTQGCHQFGAARVATGAAVFPLPTAPPNRAASARRTRRVLVPARYHRRSARRRPAIFRTPSAIPKLKSSCATLVRAAVYHDGLASALREDNVTKGAGKIDRRPTNAFGLRESRKMRLPVQAQPTRRETRRDAGAASWAGDESTCPAGLRSYCFISLCIDLSFAKSML